MIKFHANTPAALHQEEPWPLVRKALAVARPLGTATIILGLTVVAGYLLSVERLYRPFEGGPATNPLTALCIVMLGLGGQVRSNKDFGKWIYLFCALGVLMLTSVRLLDATGGAALSEWITPFQNQVAADLQAGKSNGMGVNSAIMFLFIALSMALFSFGKAVSSQVVASIAVAIPTVSFTGYVYGLDDFYGQMSLTTAIAGFIIANAALAMSAQHGGLRAILSPYLGGAIARKQLVAGFVFPFALGYAFIGVVDSSESTFLGLFVVSICWFIILMVGISAIFQEKIDSQRRHAESLLSLAATVDPLTGLSNRRKLFEFGQSEVDRLQRTKGEFWFLMIDIDRFKKVNDTAGHDAGDRVLIRLADTLKCSVRAVDLVSRMGGEEFAVILIDSNKEGAARAAESIRASVENMTVEGWTALHGPITVSIGCAGNDGQSSFENTIKLADDALYRAKENGRNQVTFSD